MGKSQITFGFVMVPDLTQYRHLLDHLITPLCGKKKPCASHIKECNYKCNLTNEKRCDILRSSKDKSIMRKIIPLILLFILSFQTISYAQDLWKITAYCPCTKCSAHWGDMTASGETAKEDYTAACNILPFGTIVEIDGLGTYTIHDRGSAKYFDNQNHIDIYMESHEEALQFGVQYREVKLCTSSSGV